MKFEFSLNRNQEKALSSSLSLVLVIGILVLVNSLAARYFWRLDLTRNKAFTLSQASKNLVGGLEDRLLVKAYFTDDLPAPYNEYRRQLEDTLAEYSMYGKGRFDYEFINPNKSMDYEQEAMAYGVQPMQFNVIEADEYRVKTGYMGLVILYEDKSEVVPFISEVETLEYALTSRFQKITSPRQLKVGFYYEEDSTPQLLENLEIVSQPLSEIYDLVYVDPSEIDTTLDVLVLAGVQSGLSDYALYRIDQAVMHGVKVLFMHDLAMINAQGFQVMPIESGLEKLLGHYGIELGSSFVADLQAKRISVQSQQGAYTISNIIDYPFIPVSSDLGESVITSNLGQLTLPFVTSLSISPNRVDQLQVDTLARSSDNSWLVQNIYDINPFQQFSPGSEKGPFDLALAVQGDFTSFFQGEMPPARPADSANAGFEGLEEIDQIDDVQAARMLLVGSSNAIMSGFVMDNTMVDFFLNAIDWLAQSDTLISIRSRAAGVTPLRDIGENSRNMIKYAIILGLPVFVAISSLVIFRFRKKRTQRVYQ